MPQDLTIAEALRDLRKDIKLLAAAHGAMQGSMKKLAGQIETCRRNIEILQDAYLKKNSIPASSIN